MAQRKNLLFCLLLYGIVSHTTAIAQWVEVVVDSQMAGDDKALVDIDGDGFVDIVAGGKRLENEALSWYRYPDWQKFIIADSLEEFTTEMDAADMDGDGDMDLVVCDGPTGINCKYFVNPRPDGNPEVKSEWTYRVIGSGGSWVHDIQTGDYNNDGRQDVITNRGLFTQNGDGSFTWSYPSGSTFGDVDGDGDLDIVIDGYWYENPGWNRHTAPSLGAIEAKVRVADINGDGKGEIFLNSGDGTGDLAWFSSANPQDGVWTKHLIEANVAGGHTLNIGDIEGDGDLDLLSAEMFGEVAIFINDGNAAFSKQLLATTGSHNAVLGDIDSDGDLDAMGCNYTGNPPLRLWRNLASAEIGDINNDKQINLLDTILGLQISAGMFVDATNIHPHADVNGDRKIGLAEAVYALERAATEP